MRSRSHLAAVLALATLQVALGGSSGAGSGAADGAAPGPKAPAPGADAKRYPQPNRRVSVDPCYEAAGAAKRCIPEFVNAAFNAPVEASSTCGASGLGRYCDDVESGGACRLCDESDPRARFPAAHLTDLNNPRNVTCWRSDPIPPDQWHAPPYAPPDNVTLTLPLGKKYEITYISLQFCPKVGIP